MVKIFGLMGFGLIAKKVNTLAKIFNAHIIAYDPFIDQVLQVNLILN
jgi:phosphoglycerate dehydrogenase-like enzyme